MAKDKISMPSGMGGLVRYYDDVKSKLEISPVHVVIMIVVVMLIMVLLHWQGNAWLGLQ